MRSFMNFNIFLSSEAASEMFFRIAGGFLKSLPYKASEEDYWKDFWKVVSNFIEASKKFTIYYHKLLSLSKIFEAIRAHT